VAVLGFCFFLLVDGLVSWGRFRFSPLRLPQVIWQKRWHFGLVALLGITSMVIFVPVNRLAGGLLWDPFTWPKLMLGATQLDWNEWWLRLQVYQAAHNIRNLAVWYGLATTVFLLTIYSTRLIGFIPTPKSIRQLGWQVWVLLFPVTVLASFVGMNFIQVSGGHNIFNFFIVALTILSLLTAVQLGNFAQRFPRWAVPLTMLIIALTIPRVIYTTVGFVGSVVNNTDSTTLNQNQLSALDFLEHHYPPNTVYQTHLYNELQKDAPYVSLFTSHQAFYGGWRVLHDHNQPVADQEALMKYLLQLGNSEQVARTMDWYGIKYLYLEKHPKNLSQHLWFPIEHSFLQKVYENPDIVVLQPAPRTAYPYLSTCREPNYSGLW
jgi:hypothetical protein